MHTYTHSFRERRLLAMTQGPTPDPNIQRLTELPLTQQPEVQRRNSTPHESVRREAERRVSGINEQLQDPVQQLETIMQQKNLSENTKAVLRQGLDISSIASLQSRYLRTISLANPADLNALASAGIRLHPQITAIMQNGYIRQSPERSTRFEQSQEYRNLMNTLAQPGIIFVLFTITEYFPVDAMIDELQHDPYLSVIEKNAIVNVLRASGHNIPPNIVFTSQGGPNQFPGIQPQTGPNGLPNMPMDRIPSFDMQQAGPVRTRWGIEDAYQLRQTRDGAIRQIEDTLAEYQAELGQRPPPLKAREMAIARLRIAGLQFSTTEDKAFVNELLNGDIHTPRFLRNADRIAEFYSRLPVTTMLWPNIVTRVAGFVAKTQISAERSGLINGTTQNAQNQPNTQNNTNTTQNQQPPATSSGTGGAQPAA